jgi:RNA polymerase sigma-70 factor (ECF subfamily)
VNGAEPHLQPETPGATDEALLEALRAGQHDVFGTLVRRYERELYGYLRRYLNDDTLAEDVFQNTFLQVFVKRKQYEPGRPVRPWLYAIATNQAIDALRRQGRHPTISLEQPADADNEPGEPATWLASLEASGPGPLDLLSTQERSERIRASVERLPDLLRPVLLLAYYQGLKYREIADILSIPVGTVKSRLHAAINRLQEIWNETPSLNEV